MAASIFEGTYAFYMYNNENDLKMGFSFCFPVLNLIWPLWFSIVVLVTYNKFCLNFFFNSLSVLCFNRALLGSSPLKSFIWLPSDDSQGYNYWKPLLGCP